MWERLENLVRNLAQWLQRVLRQPRSELDRWGMAVRFCYDLVRVGTKQLKQDRATEMAAALAFRTLFALVPVFVVATLLVRAFMGVEDFLKLIDGVLTSAGMADVRVVPSSDPAYTATEFAVQSLTLKEWIARLIEQSTHVTVAAVGWVGFIMIVYAAISLLATIEACFNVIYLAPQGRPWTRSVPMYWFLLTVSPSAISLAAWLNTHVAQWANALAWGSWATSAIAVVWNVMVMWALISTVFMLVPNTEVAARPAVIGAFVSVVLIEIGKRTLGQFLAESFAVNQLYLSLGLIPLFMFWVYLMWLAVLLGLEVSAILQQLGGRRLEEMERAAAFIGVADPAVVLTVMQRVAEDYRKGRSTSVHHLAEHARLSERQSAMVLQRLIDGGYLHRLGGSEEMVCMAKPPEETSVQELLDLGFSLADVGVARDSEGAVQRLRNAQRSLAAHWTLAGTPV